MKTERELFNEWLKYYEKHDVVIDRLQRTFMWQAWQASASREGYKLVPVEPSEDMIMAGCMEHGGYDVIDSKSIYKAMIGAVK